MWREVTRRGSKRGLMGRISVGGSSGVWRDSLDLCLPPRGQGCPGTGGVRRSGLSFRQGAEGGAEAAGVFLILLPCPIPVPRELDGWVFVELDVGSEGNADGAQIQEVLHAVISSGSVASYITSPQGFQFRRLGTGKPILGPRAHLRFF